jgi:hypothetical protein
MSQEDNGRHKKAVEELLKDAVKKGIKDYDQLLTTENLRGPAKYVNNATKHGSRTGDFQAEVKILRMACKNQKTYAYKRIFDCKL